jgi:hypothetical protein
MLTVAKNLYDYRELMATLVWKSNAKNKSMVPDPICLRLNNPSTPAHCISNTDLPTTGIAVIKKIASTRSRISARH